MAYRVAVVALMSGSVIIIVNKYNVRMRTRVRLLYYGIPLRVQRYRSWSKTNTS